MLTSSPHSNTSSFLSFNLSYMLRNCWTPCSRTYCKYGNASCHFIGLPTRSRPIRLGAEIVLQIVRMSALYNSCKMIRRISKSAYSTPVAEFLGHLHKRGVICDQTASFEKILTEPHSREKCGIYAGFDPTADGLHVGNLLVLQTLNRFRREGGFKNIYALIGGGTGMIGDPSGKKTERSLLHHDQLQYNISCLKTEIESFFYGDSNVKVVNNADWLSKFNMIDWLRDVGKFFQVNNMMRLESVKSRLGNEASAGMTFTEFSYSLLQSYDFHYLNKNYGVHGAILRPESNLYEENLTSKIVQKIQLQE
jgi:hypothetical protein